MTHQPTSGDHEGATSAEVDTTVERTPLSYTKTPLFQAYNAPRYQRQAIIKNIQHNTGRRLICYISNSSLIDHGDVVPFVDLLHNIPSGGDLDLMLHTQGGDIDTAEKLISMLRDKVEQGTLRIIVPDFAKSAGTLMVLGADYVVMSDSSELGPIDPQVPSNTSAGQGVWLPAQSYLDAYAEHTATLTNDPKDVSAQIMLGKLDPVMLQACKSVKERARTFAEEQLRRGMFRNGGNWSQAASELLDTSRWRSHSQMISWADANDTRIGLNVEYLDPKSEQWQGYWQLYCLQRLAVNDRQKLYESDYASLAIDGPAG